MTATSTSISAADAYPHYAAAYAAQSPLGSAISIPDLRRRGWEAFQRLGLPTARRGNEPWKYTNIAPVARVPFAVPQPPLPVNGAGVGPADLRAAVPWQHDWHNIVLVDGVFAPGLSGNLEVPIPTKGGCTEAMIIASLTDAINAQRGLGDVLVGYIAPPDADGFVALNSAFARDGAGVEIPEGADGGVVNIVYLTTGRAQPRATLPRTVVNAQPGSRVTVIETYAGPEDCRYLTNAVTEIYVRENARVEHYRLLQEGSDAYHIGVSRVLQYRDSRFSSVSVSRGPALGRNDFAVTLDGTGAECILNGLYLTTGSQHMDNYINIDHAEPHGTSRLFYKGILDGQSRAVFGGNVVVRKDAQKTDAQQTDKNLLLSPDAEVDSKPSLLIYADDVKCGHGATAGHIDPDTVFYMRSRGLDLPTASRILIHAFASEIIDAVTPEPLREYLDAQFRRAIPDAEITLPLGGRS